MEQAASNPKEDETDPPGTDDTGDAGDAPKEAQDGNGAIVGLMIGAAAVVILGGFAVWFVIKKKK